ncbi:hypothetical protein NDN11_18145 [Acinetobacter sp. C26M]|uniref:hypothetical protein n=1 Tax=unclassified Acinetobacter TaxID=196816 RepID=UPI0020372DC2|nr:MULTISPECIES: hypothetical protein [unclassified Acinetobacter]USA46567.1 hypothetical protein NDN11_18145 [Acinetobacter sp. C26M]USA50051.1 hypothetical protein NDN12_18060 [Acinetobacter sp. C26G]
MSYILNSLVCIVVFLGVSTSSYAVTEVYKCEEKGSIIFQSRPCKGTGQTVAGKLQDEREAKEKRLTELRAKEDRSQEKLKQQPNKEMTFTKAVKKIKNKIFRSWDDFKDRFTIDS